MGKWRLPIPRSIGARSAVAAALVSAVLFAGAAVWIREVLYSERMAAAEQKARADIDRIMRLAFQTFHPPMVDPGITYEVVHSDGRVLSRSHEMHFYDVDRPFMPVPPPGPPMAEIEQFTARFGAPAQPIPPGLDVRDMSGRTMRVLAFTTLEALLTPPDENGFLNATDFGSRIRLYVFVTPFDAENAVAAIDRVLWPVVPLAVLVVAAVAWLATTRALRPVDRISAQAAAISASALHRRVPVPDTRDAVARLAVTLNETLDRLELSAELQRRFVADAAHELRSPIASARTVLEVALAHADRADWPRMAGDAVIDVRRLERLAEDLLLLARFDAAQPAPTQPVDLAELVKTQVAGRDGPVTCTANQQAPVLGNPGHLDRLLRNLLDNAERHARGSVEVTVEVRRALVVLHVVDDGPGIPEADRERVFERFTRLDEARARDDGGTGLGLAIAWDIATRHGGRLRVADSTTGAHLVATFPRHAENGASSSG